MMKKLLLAAVTVLMLACTTPVFLRQPAPIPNQIPASPPTNTPVPIPTAVLATAEPISPSPTAEARSEAGIPLPYNENILINLARAACKARWSNNLAYLPCPGDRSAVDGAVLSLEQPSFPNGMVIRNRTLLTIPGYGSNGGGIFGRYPALLVVNENTHFRAGLTCLSSPCQAEFGLGYYDQAGKYYDLTTWEVDSARFTEDYGHWDEVDYDLSPFLGQRIELVLIVRNPPHTRVEALWVEPMIYLKY